MLDWLTLIFAAIAAFPIKVDVSEYAFRYNPVRTGKRRWLACLVTALARYGAWTVLAGRGARMATSIQDYDRLTRARYSYADADRIARVSRGTSRRWVKGYSYWRGPERVKLPPITSADGSEAAVSFFDLIGIVAIRELRKAELSLPQVRKVVEYCQRQLGLEYPLVTETFRTDGREIFIEAEGHLLDVGKQSGQQVWDEVVAPFLQTIDYHHEVARRWWPLGRDVRVVVDPRYGFGLPVIAGSGVRTEIIAERDKAGDTKNEIAYDFGVTVAEVKDALTYENLPRAA